MTKETRLMGNLEERLRQVSPDEKRKTMIYLSFGRFGNTPGKKNYGLDLEVTDIDRVKRNCPQEVEYIRGDKIGAVYRLLECGRFFGRDYQEREDLSSYLEEVRTKFKNSPEVMEYLREVTKPNALDSFSLGDYCQFWDFCCGPGFNYLSLLEPEKVQFAVGDLCEISKTTIQDCYDSTMRFLERNIELCEAQGHTDLEITSSDCYGGYLKLRETMLNIDSTWNEYMNSLRKFGIEEVEIQRLNGGSLA